MRFGKGFCNACLAHKPATILILMMSLLVGRQLRTTILKAMLNVFPISSAVLWNHFCLAVNWIYSQIKSAKQKIRSYLFEDSITEATEGNDIPSDTMQIMSCSDYKNRACWLHTCLPTAQLSATDTLPMSADKILAR